MATDAAKIIPDAPVLDVKHLLLRRNLVWAGGMALGSVVCLAALGLWIWPMGSQTRTDLIKTEQSLEAARQRSSVLIGIQPEDQQNFLRVAQTLPVNKEPLVVLQALTNIAQEVGVNVSQYDTNPGLVSTGSAVANRSTKGSQVQSLVVAVEMSGTFQQIKQALELLESAAPIMEVTELSLAPNTREAGEEGATVYRAKLQLTSYFLPPTVAGAGGSVAKALTSQQQSTFDITRPWRNRLPDRNLTPEIYARTNLFQLEVATPEDSPGNGSIDIAPAEVPAETAREQDVETQ